MQLLIPSLPSETILTSLGSCWSDGGALTGKRMTEGILLFHPQVLNPGSLWGIDIFGATLWEN